MFGEDLQNAHDAMSDTIALRKIAEYGAVSQGKNCQTQFAYWRIHQMFLPI